MTEKPINISASPKLGYMVISVIISTLIIIALFQVNYTLSVLNRLVVPEQQQLVNKLLDAEARITDLEQENRVIMKILRSTAPAGLLPDLPPEKENKKPIGDPLGDSVGDLP
jgi:hypothetical protein